MDELYNNTGIKRKRKIVIWKIDLAPIWCFLYQQKKKKTFKN